MRKSLKSAVLAVAKGLFMAHGYEAVGMREIAHAVGREPVQLYRLHLSKSDILAELIVMLNDEEIQRLPEILAMLEAGALVDRVCGYLRGLYAMDIEYLPIRSVGAAHGWSWGPNHEARVITQVLQLIQPVATWMTEAGLDRIEARCYGLWSVYYVGFRRAVVHGEDADACIREIRPSLELLLMPTPAQWPTPTAAETQEVSATPNR